MSNFTIEQMEFHFPDAKNWMWNYCLPLGKFTDSRGNNYDLGVYIYENDSPIATTNMRISAAIVFSNEAGDYYSGSVVERGNVKYNVNQTDVVAQMEEKYVETLKRCKALGIV